MAEDPIVAEVRRVRAAHARKFNYELEAIFRDIKEQEKRSGKKFSRYPARLSAPAPSGGETSEDKAG